VFTDSAIVADQIRHESPRMKSYMKPLHAEVRRLLAEIGEGQVRISWLPGNCTERPISERQRHIRQVLTGGPRGAARSPQHSFEGTYVCDIQDRAARRTASTLTSGGYGGLVLPPNVDSFPGPSGPSFQVSTEAGQDQRHWDRTRRHRGQPVAGGMSSPRSAG
jgi:hypothetical protein